MILTVICIISLWFLAVATVVILNRDRIKVKKHEPEVIKGYGIVRTFNKGQKSSKVSGVVYIELYDNGDIYVECEEDKEI